MSESRSVVSNSLRLHELHSPWNSPGKNTGVGSPSLLQGIFPIQGRILVFQTQVSHVAGGFFTSWATGEAPFVKRNTKSGQKQSANSSVIFKFVCQFQKSNSILTEVKLYGDREG